MRLSVRLVSDWCLALLGGFLSMFWLTMVQYHGVVYFGEYYGTIAVLRGTRRVCVTIQDCVMSTENLERERM